MVQTDPIADMLTVIRNGLMVKQKTVQCPYSAIKVGVLEALKREGFLASFTVFDRAPTGKAIKIVLKYGPKGEKVINSIDRVSKPGRRIYRGIADLKPILQGFGISILSTAQGIMSDREARDKKVGGEVLCKVY